MAARTPDSVLYTLPIVLLVVVVIAAVAKLAHDDASPDAAPDIPSASVSIPTGTPADRGTPGSPDASTPPSTPPSTPSSPTSSMCVPGEESSHLVVLTFNIHSARASDGSVHLDTIAREIARWDADVVLLQEVDRGRAWTGRVDMPAVLAEHLGSTWTFGANTRRSPTNELGNATLSRFPITDSRNVPLPGPPGTQPRGLLAATIDVGGTEVSVYNTHLENTSRAARLVQMRVVARVLADDQRPTILGGDLNSGPDSPVLATARRVASDTWPEAGLGPGYTHSARAPRVRIDYLMYDDGGDTDLEPVDAVVLRSAVSDHWALRADYRLVTDSGEVCVPLLDGDDLP